MVTQSRMLVKTSIVIVDRRGGAYDGGTVGEPQQFVFEWSYTVEAETPFSIHEFGIGSWNVANTPEIDLNMLLEKLIA